MQHTTIRVLVATAANDAFIERIEASLSRVLDHRGHDLLLLVQGREPATTGIATLDLEDLDDVDSVPPDAYARLHDELGRVIDNTRWYAQTRGEPDGRAAIDDRLVAAAQSIDRILDEYAPHVVMVWNGLLSGRAVMADRAWRRNIPVFFAERGALPGSWYADPLGVNAASSIAVSPLPADLAETLNTPLSLSDLADIVAEIEAGAAAGASAWEQAALRGQGAWRTKLGLADDARVLFFPMQVDADTNMRFFSPHFAGSLPALEAIAAAVREMPGWTLLVKPHPKGTYPPGAIERLVDSVGQCVADINLHDALGLCSAVVTINSTVAAEAAWAGKPVLQLGRGILSGKRIVTEYEPARPLARQVAEMLDRWQTDSEDHDRALRFYRFLKQSYLMRADADTDTARWVSHIERLLIPCTASMSGHSAHAVANAHAWQPARRLLDRLAARTPRPTRVVLVGYGRNGRKLLAEAARHPICSELQWAVWDDDASARANAVRAGLTLYRSASACDLMLVTPRSSDSLVRKLEQAGKLPDRDYYCLFERELTNTSYPEP